jgi:hypothetical protein
LLCALCAADKPLVTCYHAEHRTHHRRLAQLPGTFQPLHTSQLLQRGSVVVWIVDGRVLQQRVILGVALGQQQWQRLQRSCANQLVFRHAQCCVAPGFWLLVQLQTRHCMHGKCMSADGFQIRIHIHYIMM